MPGSQFASSLFTAPDWQNATAEVCQEIGNQLTDPATLAFVFISQHHAEHAEDIGRQIQTATGCQAMIGCTGESIIGLSLIHI